jgi:uncharacterized membrane protein
VDRLAYVRGVIAALVGAFLVVYAVVVSPLNRVVVGVVGLVLLGVITVDLLARRRPD